MAYACKYRKVDELGKKYYAVKKGRKVGIFTTWDECKKQVDGFSGAIYKSFPDYDMAVQYVQGGQGTAGQKGRKQTEETEKECGAYAYIDGSYDNRKKVYGSAVLLFVEGKKISHKFAGNQPELIKLRNVAGEIEAAKYVMQYAYDQGIKQIKIYYDYAGIEMWAKKDWKANLNYTKEYASFYENIAEHVEVIFSKVKAHTGNQYNEEADLLAKSAVADFANKMFT